MKRQLAIILAVLCFVATSAQADRTPWTAKVSGAGAELQLLASIGQAVGAGQREQLPHSLRIDGYVRSFGRFTAQLNLRRWGLNTKSSRTQAFLQGSGKFRTLGNISIPVSGTIKAGVLRLFILGDGAPSRRSLRMLEVSVPLTALSTGSWNGRSSRTLRRSGSTACGTVSSVNATAGVGSVVALPAHVARNLRVLEIAVQGDYEWAQQTGPGAGDAIATILNASEAIYSQQLSVTMDIKGLTVIDSLPQPFTSTDLDGILQQVIDNKAPVSADLYHLFTGKDLGVLGVAYDIGTICRTPNESVSITVHDSPAEDILSFTHEVGHNFGAEHDSSEPPSIMYPGPADGISSFSQNSINEMQIHLNQFGSCLSEQGGGGTPQPTPTPSPGQTALLDVFREVDRGISAIWAFSYQGDYEPVTGVALDLMWRNRRSPLQVLETDVTDVDGYLGYDVRRAGFYSYQLSGRPETRSREIRVRRLRR